jgi:hypothetical protein
LHEVHSSQNSKQPFKFCHLELSGLASSVGLLYHLSKVHLDLLKLSVHLLPHAGTELIHLLLEVDKLLVNDGVVLLQLVEE